MNHLRERVWKRKHKGSICAGSFPNLFHLSRKAGPCGCCINIYPSATDGRIIWKCRNLDLNPVVLTSCGPFHPGELQGQWESFISVPENGELLGHPSRKGGYLHANKWELGARVAPWGRPLQARPPSRSRFELQESAACIQFSWAKCADRAGDVPRSGRLQRAGLRVREATFLPFTPVPLGVLRVEASTFWEVHELRVVWRS